MNFNEFNEFNKIHNLNFEKRIFFFFFKKNYNIEMKNYRLFRCELPTEIRLEAFSSVRAIPLCNGTTKCSAQRRHSAGELVVPTLTCWKVRIRSEL